MRLLESVSQGKRSYQIFSIDSGLISVRVQVPVEQAQLFEEALIDLRDAGSAPGAKKLIALAEQHGGFERKL